jgi:hypothetical protein
MGEKINECWILMGNPEGKGPLGRPRHRWADNTEMDLREIEWGGIDCIGLTQNRNQWKALLNTVINFQVPQNVGKFLRSPSKEGLSSMTSVSQGVYMKKLKAVTRFLRTC